MYSNVFKYKLVDTIKQEATGWELYLCIELSHHESHSQKYLLCFVMYTENLDNFLMISLYFRRICIVCTLGKKFKPIMINLWGL